MNRIKNIDIKIDIPNTAIKIDILTSSKDEAEITNDILGHLIKNEEDIRKADPDEFGVFSEFITDYNDNIIASIKYTIEYEKNK